MRHPLSVLGLCCGALLSAAAVAQNGPVFSIMLDGGQEVPPNTSPATGSGSATLNSATGELSLFYQFSGLLGPQTAAHIHQAPAGTNGPIIVPLPNGSPVNGVFQLSAAQVGALLNNNLYINVHTTVFPGGEIRGQILLTGACCIGADCTQLTPARCAAAGGVFQGPGTVCANVQCAPPPVIFDVLPRQAATGEIIRIIGENFPSDPNDICTVVANGNMLIPLDVFSSTPDEIMAIMGPIPHDATPGPLMLMTGQGERKGFRPAFFDIFVEDPLDTWAWRGDGRPAAVAPNPFVPLPTDPPTGTTYTYGEIQNGTLCIIIDGDWTPDKKVTVWNRLHGQQAGVPFFFHDLRTCVRFHVGGTTAECAERLCDTMRCIFGQQNPPVTVDCQIVPLPDGRFKIVVRIPNGTITSGTLTFCVSMPDMDLLAPPLPPLPVTAFGNALIEPMAIGVLVHNLGSSGLDGVSVDLPGAGEGLDLDIDPLDLDIPQRCLNLRAWGDWDGQHAWPLGLGSLWGRPESCLDASADFSSVGSPTVRIEVYNGNLLVGSFVRPNGNVGVVQGEPGQRVPPIGGCGKLPPFPLPCFFFDFDTPMFFTPIGSTQRVMGTSIRLLANAASAPINQIDLFDLSLVNPAGIPPQNIRIRAGQLLPGPLPCPCDWNRDGVLSSQDFFDFIVAFFSGQADINGDGATTSQDFFDFLTCFFSPPPGC